jgi:hypothetical protein
VVKKVFPFAVLALLAEKQPDLLAVPRYNSLFVIIAQLAAQDRLTKFVPDLAVAFFLQP